MIRPAPAIDAIAPMTPFIGPEQLMRETGRSELVRLGANESAFGPSPNAVAAMAAELERLSWYGDPESYQLREALARKHGCRVEEVLVGAGIDDLMGLVVRAFVAPGGAALTTRGSYPTFNYHVHGYGGRLVFADYLPDGRLDFDQLAAVAARERAAVVYVANPDNPSGTFAGKDAMLRLFEALPRDAVFLLDEAYADFVDEAALLPMYVEDRLIRTRTFSKAYGMAGGRIGYAIASERVNGILQKIRLQYGVNRNAQIGALASLADEPFRRHVVDAVATARGDYYALARELGLGAIDSSTNFVCIDLGDAARATTVMNELLARGVWIRKPGLPPLDRFVRVSAGTPPQREAFARAFREVLAAVPSVSA
ncbi:MAG TPA: aminotransferase class I/II-fold pyridoxal phosphate-dependent enzyme [Candidatus Baltobacteraceae bacterium]|nr:aminotransferase class I/II-fold pyridoxal phosphate-dependent enzyme [Candidatus Baltobacteraceae bacterium]